MASISGNAYRILRGITFVSPWLLQLAVADLCLCALLPVSIVRPTLSYDISSSIAASVWNAVQLIFTSLNGAKVTTSGATLPLNESAIIVSNHLAWTDFYMIQSLAIEAGMLGRCRWFAKKQLQWVPLLGVGLRVMGMPLVSRNWLQDRTELRRTFDNIVDHQWPIWLISYSESTRFSNKKHAEAVQWCREHGKALPQHTLHPRTRGFVATVQELRRASHVKAVYDVTIAYARGSNFLATPSFWQTLSDPAMGRAWRFHAHVERFPLDTLPHSSADLAAWLEQRWIEKGSRLEDLRQALSRGRPWGNRSRERPVSPGWAFSDKQ